MGKLFPSWMSASCSCALAGFGLLAAGCNWNEFDAYPDDAPIRVLAEPKSFGGADYGSVVTTFHGPVQGREVSRVMASGGRATPLVITRAWNGSKLDESRTLRCVRPGDCKLGRDVGVTLIPFGGWGLQTSQPHSGCVYAPSNASDPEGGVWAYVSCETRQNPQHFDAGLSALRGVGGNLQFSGFGLPAGHPAGVVVLGVYATESQNNRVRRGGGLYVQEDLLAETGEPLMLQLVRLIDPATQQPFTDDPDVGDFGHQVVGAQNAQGELLVAVSQPSRQRVLVATYDESAPGAAVDKFVVRACIPSPDLALSTFGERLAFGDVSGDGDPELFIGSDPEAGEQALFMYAGSGLPGKLAQGARCPDWGEPPATISCPDGVDGLSCEGAAFGSSFAVGDIDGDQLGDLIVGAPRTSVNGVLEAGAAYVIPAQAGGLDAARAIALVSQPRSKAHLGASVAALRTRDRDEPVVGAPGVSEIYLFMCTELEDGFGGKSLCLSE